MPGQADPNAPPGQAGPQEAPLEGEAPGPPPPL